MESPNDAVPSHALSSIAADYNSSSSGDSLSPPPTETTTTTTTTTDAPASDSVDDDTTATTITTASEPPPSTATAASAASTATVALHVKKRGRKRKHYPAVASSMVLRPHAKSFALSDFIAAQQAHHRHRHRRRRLSVLSKDLDVEALIAISVGFPVDSLTEEEIEANVISTIGGADQNNYIVVRNHILARWRSDVSLSVTRDAAMDSIRSEHSHLVDSAFRFLLEHGYINFGLSPAIKQVSLAAASPEKKCPYVIVVGAGLAGLAATRQLISLGFRVLILEGRNRPGGRVKTRKMHGGEVAAAADLGGSVLTGINGNPFGVLARQLGFPLHKVRDICPLYLPNGKAVDSEIDSKVETSFNKLLDKVCKLRHIMLEEVRCADVSLGVALEAFRDAFKVAEDPQERMLLNWHLANLEYANATLLSNLSMAYWDQDDPYEMGGDHCFIPGGNERLVRALAEDVPIVYGKRVESIRYGVDGVMVYAGGQSFRADMVLCTVPLGVLKRGDIEFVPELPQRKRDAISRLGFGLLNKVAMLFPYDFWGGEIDTFGHLCEDPAMRGEFFLFYSYTSVSGGPLLVALVAGEAAVKFESLSPLDSVERVMDILRGIFVPKGIEVPDPVQAVCTRWGQDQFSYGSYSYVAVGSSGDDYDILSESIADGRIFFAGEATNKQYPATMHGAFLSGMREAANMLRAAKRRCLILANEANNIEEKEENRIDPDLNKLFEKPDMKFGSFSVLLDNKSDDDLECKCLVQVELGGEDGLFHLYGLIGERQASELGELDGDVNRLKALNQKYGVTLVGRKEFCSIALSLIDSIKSARVHSDGALVV